MMTVNRNGYIYQILMNISVMKQLEPEELLRCYAHCHTKLSSRH